MNNFHQIIFPGNINFVISAFFRNYKLNFGPNSLLTRLFLLPCELFDYNLSSIRGGRVGKGGVGLGVGGGQGRV